MRLPRRLSPGEEATRVEHSTSRARACSSRSARSSSPVVAHIFHERLIKWSASPAGRQGARRSATEPFTTSIKVSLYAAFALALPVLLWQLWSFLAPAMEESAQRVVAVFVGIATVLFAGGLAFGYFVLMPKAIEFLMNYDSDLYDIQIRAITTSRSSRSCSSPSRSSSSSRSSSWRSSGSASSPDPAAKEQGIPGRGRSRARGRAANCRPRLPRAGDGSSLLILLESSIWAAVFLEKRWHPTSATLLL